MSNHLSGPQYGGPGAKPGPYDDEPRCTCVSGLLDPCPAHLPWDYGSLPGSERLHQWADGLLDLTGEEARAVVVEIEAHRLTPTQPPDPTGTTPRRTT